MVLQSYDAIADRIIAEIAPTRVLYVGCGHAPLVSALRARGREAFGIEISKRAIADVPPGIQPYCWVASPVTAIDAQYDLIVCVGGLDSLIEDDQRHVLENICCATEDILFMPNPDAPNERLRAGRPRSYWAELFAEYGFFLDADFDAGFLGPSGMRFRKTRARRNLESSLRMQLKRRDEEANTLYWTVDEQDKVIKALRLKLTAYEATLGWRALERFRGIRERLLQHSLLRHAYWALRRSVEVFLDEGSKKVLRKAGHKIGLALRGRNFLVQPPREYIPQDLNAQYRLWLERHQLTAGDLRSMKAAVDRFSQAPVVSILTVVESGKETAVDRAVETVRAQIYPHWELCVAIMWPTEAETKRRLEDARAGEPRLRIAESDGIEAAYGAALKLAGGDFVGFFDVQDELAPEALFKSVERLNEDPSLDVIYSDEDALAADGRRVDPFFKPDWSPDLTLSTNYIGHFCILRRKLLEDLGGFRPGFGGGEVYDLILRAAERTDKIAHIPEILYHRRQQVPSASAMAAKRTAMEAEKRAIEDALRRRGLDGYVQSIPSGLNSLRYYSVRYRLRGTPLVSIIIPTKDKWHLLEQCIRSIQEKTSYHRYEITIVDNESTEPETLNYLNSLVGKCRVYACQGRFNFSKINNFGVAQANGEYLLFLNNDVEVIRSDWLTAMLEHAQRPEVGAVGAKLLYPDGRIQHAGVVVGIGGAAAHAFRLWPGDEVSDPRLAHIVRNCSAVTAACMMVPRRVFDEVGGFGERLRVVFGDVDLCLKIRERGYLIVYTPFTLLYHHEGASRGRLHPSEDEQLFRAAWAGFIKRGDPYYNPNLTDARDDWSLRL